MPEFVAQPTDETEQVTRLDRVHAGIGLVEQQHSRARPDGPRDLEPALVAVGQVAGESIALVLESGQPEQLERLRLELALRALERRARQEGADQRRRRLALEPDLDVVEDRQVAEQADVLEGTADSHPGDGVGRRAGDVATVERDRAARWPEEPGQEMEQRRLAGAVRTDDAVDRQRVETKLVVDQRLEAAERLGQAAGLEQRCRFAIGVRSPDLHPAEDTSPRSRVPCPRTSGGPGPCAGLPSLPRRPGSADVARSVHVDRGPSRMAG